MSRRPTIDNARARAIFLDRHALAEVPSGPANGSQLLDLIVRLGFVQLDSINTLERAHHMILRARRTSYRPRHLAPLLNRDRTLFEHWTHDAAVIPTQFYPHWQLRFARDAARMRERWVNWRTGDWQAKFDDVLTHIRDHGPASSGDVGTDETRSKGGWWEWHPSKTALEYLWRSGKLTVCHRDGFTKVYDLTERVLDEVVTGHRPPQEESIDWLNHAALDRLGFATSGELAAFWDTVTPAEAKHWVAARLADGTLIEVDVENADGTLRRHVARPEIVAADPPPPPGRLRILSPFDPALRDRKRAERLFGFHYRIEVFVPEPKRQYGYYVFPMLEGDRLVGRIDTKAPGASDAIEVRAVWPERGLSLSKARLGKLEAELDRMRGFTGKAEVEFADGWRRSSL